MEESTFLETYEACIALRMHLKEALAQAEKQVLAKQHTNLTAGQFYLVLVLTAHQILTSERWMEADDISRFANLIRQDEIYHPSEDCPFTIEQIDQELEYR